MGQTIYWSGYYWSVREGQDLGPDDNYWSATNVTIDGGALVITITEGVDVAGNRTWTSGMVTTLQSFRGGVFEYNMAEGILPVGSNVTLGMYLYGGSPDTTNELDIEIAEFDKTDQTKNVNFTTWTFAPPNEAPINGLPENQHSFHCETINNATMHVIDWQKDIINYSILNMPKSTFINNYTYTPTSTISLVDETIVPQVANANLYTRDRKNFSDPSTTFPRSVRINSFVVRSRENFYLGIGSVEGDLYAKVPVVVASYTTPIPPNTQKDYYPGFQLPLPLSAWGKLAFDTDINPIVQVRNENTSHVFISTKGFSLPCFATYTDNHIRWMPGTPIRGAQFTNECTMQCWGTNFKETTYVIALTDLPGQILAFYLPNYLEQINPPVWTYSALASPKFFTGHLIRIIAVRTTRSSVELIGLDQYGNIGVVAYQDYSAELWHTGQFIALYPGKNNIYSSICSIQWSATSVTLFSRLGSKFSNTFQGYFTVATNTNTGWAQSSQNMNVSFDARSVVSIFWQGTAYLFGIHPQSGYPYVLSTFTPPGSTWTPGDRLPHPPGETQFSQISCRIDVDLTLQVVGIGLNTGIAYIIAQLNRGIWVAGSALPTLPCPIGKSSSFSRID